MRSRAFGSRSLCRSALSQGHARERPSATSRSRDRDRRGHAACSEDHFLYARHNRRAREVDESLFVLEELAARLPRLWVLAERLQSFAALVPDFCDAIERLGRVSEAAQPLA